ncbi:hypothetical protein [Deinococcus koreensis]|uniref:Uncharacterized protein n=1 Tax=Deinococcus koreensis TaxID=2054903 RepID=A0A2K3URZ7_9DEIO|nr:hypothetical protein [Deinococcus koreensis]PNY79287.1 hypothetical protein CVO96_19350 [Deinococcus koreensis]
MIKSLLSTLTALTLTAGAAFAAPSAVLPVTAMSDEGMAYTELYTESSWMALDVPGSALQGAQLSSLSLDVSGLPTGTTVTLDDVTALGEDVLLHVTVARASTEQFVNALATINVKSGDEIVATLSIPVIGAASAE